MKSQPPNLLATLIQGAGVALSVQIISIGTIYACQVLLARWLGVTEYGAYNLALTIGLSLAFVAGLGFPTAILRFISEYRVKQDWARLRGILQVSWQQTLIASLMLASISTAALVWFSTGRSLEYLTSIIWGIWLMPLMALINLQQQIARAFQKIILAYAPYLIFYPLLLIGLTFIWQLHQRLFSQSAIFLSISSILLVLIVQTWIFQQNLDPEIRHAHPTYAIKQWWKVALPMMFLDGSSVILSQSDTLMLGVMLGAKAVGFYSAALKTSAWVQFILTAVNAIAAPMIASLYAQNDHQGLQKLVSTIARWMFYPALAIAVGLISFAEPVLQLFGSEFIAAKGALVVLILGQLVNVGSGSVGYLLLMTGHQSQAALVMSVTAIVNIVLNLVMIHWFGIFGAGLATALSLVLWNVWLHAIVVKRLNVHPSILAAFRASELKIK